MSKQYNVGGQPITTKTFGNMIADWTKSTSDRFADLQVFAEFAMDHYVTHGDTVYITQAHHAARATKGVRLATFQSWACATVNVKATGKDGELRYAKASKGLPTYAEGVNPDAISFWADFDTQGLVPVKPYNLAKLEDDLAKIAANDKGQSTDVDTPTQAVARSLLVQVQQVIEASQMAALEVVGARNLRVVETTESAAEAPAELEDDSQDDFLAELEDIAEVA